MTAVRSTSLTVLATLLLQGAVFAQTAPVPGNVLPGAVQPGRDRPEIAPPTQPDFDFSIEAPRRSAVGRSADQLKFTLTDLHVTGATAIPADTLRLTYAGLLGKTVMLADILGVAEKIEQLVPAVIAKLPVDSFEGKPFIFKRLADGYLLYTVGQNGNDDGGSNNDTSVFEGRIIDDLEPAEAEMLRVKIPNGTDDISIRIPRPIFKLPPAAAPK